MKKEKLKELFFSESAENRDLALTIALNNGYKMTMFVKWFLEIANLNELVRSHNNLNFVIGCFDITTTKKYLTDFEQQFYKTEMDKPIFKTKNRKPYSFYTFNVFAHQRKISLHMLEINQIKNTNQLRSVLAKVFRIVAEELKLRSLVTEL